MRATITAMEPSIALHPIAIVTTTVGSAADAERLAQGAVQAQLAACVQVEAITSHYVWDGQMECSAEWRMVCKTLPASVEALRAWFHAAHPYDVPQLLLRTEHADPAYAAWVAEQVLAKK